jgi:hypothetical protein
LLRLSFGGNNALRESVVTPVFLFLSTFFIQVLLASYLSIFSAVNTFMYKTLPKPVDKFARLGFEKRSLAW